jgi:tetratricopeptide (TPR) repeat protein
MYRSARPVVILCLAALCAPAADRDPWLKITSANFELYTTAGERAGRDLIRHFEQVRSFFLQAFGTGLPDAKPVRIIAFRNEKEYEPYRPNEFATAFFQPGDAHDFIIMSGASSEQYHVAVHEFAHLMVHQGGASYPPWLNEGLAELFSNLQPLGNKIKVGQDIPGRMITLRTDKWIPLSTLLQVDRNSPYYNEKAKAGMFYAESWELVHMLFLSPEYAPQLKAMSAALKQGDAAAAFQSTYHKSIADIESDLRRYLSGDTIKVFLFSIQLPKSVDTPEIEPASAMTARVALAELLTIYRGRVDQARAAYESLAKDFPQSWEVEEGWGQWCWRQRKLDDAAKHYARAVSLGARDERLFLAYGRVLGYTNHNAEAVEVLGKAAALHPESDEIHLDLGALYVRNGNFGAALAQLRMIKKVQPGQAYRYLYNQAFAEYRLGQTEDAKTHAAKARSYTHNPAELFSLDRLERSLESRTAPVLPGPANAIETGEAPRMVRRADPVRVSEEAAPAPPPPPALPSVDGLLETMECGKLARLHVRVDGKVSVFVIPDPRAVSIRGGSGEPVDLQCGAQKPARAVHIEYQALPEKSDAAGLVRSLEFK